MPEYLNTPILFLIFNRPEYTKEVFNQIRQVKPTKFFVAADGPRKDRLGEIERCQKSRDIINQVDWKCEIFTLFREENLGCKIAVASAIDWFFSHVEEGIILEDDCVPDPSFFPFCQKLLEKYRENDRIMMITGTNYLFLKHDIKETYFFSKYYVIWGWATWRRAWQLYDITMANWPKYRDSSQLNRIYLDNRLISWYNTMFQLAYENKIDTWDIQWWYSCIFNNGLCIVPKFNLISNIGEFGHFHDGKQNFNEYIRMPTKQIICDNLFNPEFIAVNDKLDKITIDRIFGREPGLLFRAKSKINYHYLQLLSHFFELKRRIRSKILNIWALLKRS